METIVTQRSGMRLDDRILLAHIEGDMPFFQTNATGDKPIGWQSEVDWNDALKAMRDVNIVKPNVTAA